MFKRTLYTYLNREDFFKKRKTMLKEEIEGVSKIEILNIDEDKYKTLDIKLITFTVLL